MTNLQKQQAVALHLQGVMSMLSDFFDALVGRGQHNVILIVGAGDVEQYISNVPRERGVHSLQHLLARWKVGLPDTLPGEHSPANIAPFEYLLREYEAALQRERAGGAGGMGATAENARAELLAHVTTLTGKANRSARP